MFFLSVFEGEVQRSEDAKCCRDSDMKSVVVDHVRTKERASQ